MAREMKNFHFFTKFGIGPNWKYYTYRSDKIVERLLGTIPKVHCNNGLFERFLIMFTIGQRQRGHYQVYVWLSLLNNLT